MSNHPDVLDPTMQGGWPPPTDRSSAPPGLRLVLALVAPVFALSVAASTLLTQYREPTEMMADTSADPGLAGLLGILHLLTVLTLVPGVLVAGLAALRGAPRLASVALVLAVPGWAAALALPDPEVIARELVAADVDGSRAVAVLEALGEAGSPEAAVAIGLFVIGHIIGTVLLGAALLRARAVPVVVGVLFAGSQLLHFVAFVILENPWLDAFSYSLTALGLGFAGWAYYRRG